MNPRLEQEAQQVLGVVSHAQHVFGGGVPPTEPPAFAPRRDLEDDLGGGYFSAPGTAGATAPTQRHSQSVGGDDDHDAGGHFADALADRRVLGGAWTRAGSGSGTSR
ncbi:hypothetical protein OK015_28660 (plasmid) [Mycobacterium sp. Aquia_216]|uniref:hypothetical protein n=1 Tax=Mycobacterium sp. Aquia_216 TaxID=2991729 RepID=UPI00227BABC6|nr:hypothetical protein [Mycobacterium sp. Aquia_216]WAJ48022.1 hypothetical protein OK015_28660 [Mycobacterium sp. Aquia_216]